MPDFDLNAAPSGLAAGTALPNRASGLSDTIKSITNDLRAAATNRQEQAATQQKHSLDMRNQNIDIMKTLISAKHTFKGSNIEDFLSTGDTSMFAPPANPFQEMRDSGVLEGGQGAGGMLGNNANLRLEGMSVNAKGEPTTTYKAANIPAAEMGRAVLAEKAISDIGAVRSLMFPKGTKESYKSGLAAASNVPMNRFPGIGLVVPTAMPFNKDAQTVARKMQDAITGKVLIQTGVAARPEEVQAERDKYIPTFASHGDSVWDSFNELQQFYSVYNQGLKSGHISWKEGAGIIPLTQEGERIKQMLLSDRQQQQQGGAGSMLQGSGQWVVMVKPNGEKVEVSADSVQEALAAGYKGG